MYTISVVITTHGKGHDLPVILGALENQRAYLPKKINGKELRWFAGPKSQVMLEVIVACDGKFEGTLPDYAYLVECPKQGGVGHHTRQPGIKFTEGNFVVLTNSDNYFVSGFLHSLHKELADNVGVVYWNCVNNLWSWGTLGGSKLARGRIDLSCAAVRSDISKAVGFPFRNYDGDWDYVNACCNLAKKNKLKIIYIDQILAIHN